LPPSAQESEQQHRCAVAAGIKILVVRGYRNANQSTILGSPISQSGHRLGALTAEQTLP